MSTILTTNDNYKEFIENLKEQIKSSSQKVVKTVNSELIKLYYQIGKQIVEKQTKASWGDNLIGQIEQDLKLAFPKIRGFSKVNLHYMRRLYLFCKENQIVPQAVEQIPWDLYPLDY